MIWNQKDEAGENPGLFTFSLEPMGQPSWFCSPSSRSSNQIIKFPFISHHAQRTTTTVTAEIEIQKDAEIGELIKPTVNCENDDNNADKTQ